MPPFFLDLMLLRILPVLFYPNPCGRGEKKESSSGREALASQVGCGKESKGLLLTKADLLYSFLSFPF